MILIDLILINFCLFKIYYRMSITNQINRRRMLKEACAIEHGINE